VGKLQPGPLPEPISPAEKALKEHRKNGKLLDQFRQAKTASKGNE